MLLEAKFRLASPILGGLKPDQGGVRRFRRTNGRLVVEQFRLEESMRMAGHNLGLDSAEIFVRFEHTCQPPTIVLHDRHFRQSGILCRELFEAIRKGTVITLNCMLRDDLPGCPDLSKVSEMLGLVGEYAGMSPFGSKFGMGRFCVESLSSPLKQRNFEEHHGQTKAVEAGH